MGFKRSLTGRAVGQFSMSAMARLRQGKTICEGNGYAEPIGELTPVSRDSARAYFDQMIANIRDPHGYAVWMVPVLSAGIP